MNRVRCGSSRSTGTSENLNHFTVWNSVASNLMGCLRSARTTYQSETSVCPAVEPTVTVHVTINGASIAWSAVRPSSSRSSRKTVVLGCSPGSTWPPDGNQRRALFVVYQENVIHINVDNGKIRHQMLWRRCRLRHAKKRSSRVEPSECVREVLLLERVERCDRQKLSADEISHT
jgi:hypothetical protein